MTAPVDDRPWTVEELLAIHRLPAELVGLPRYDSLWHFDLPLPPETLWPVISDSSRMNRAIGLSEMAFAPVAGRLRGSSRAGGFRHEWTEVPWNWVLNQWLESVRIYDRGLMRFIFTVFHLQPHRGGTRLYVFFGMVPRNWLARIALGIGVPPLRREYARVLPKIVEDLRAGRTALVAEATGLAEGAEARLAPITDKLVALKLDPTCVTKLVDWVKTADDQDLYRIQIRERARAWQVDEIELLRVALHATRAGLLALSWDIVCPHCRGVTVERTALGEITAKGSCEICQIEFGTDSAQAVEITFHVHPSIRDVPKRFFCSGEPSKKAHIRVQVAVPPGQRATIRPTLRPGRYRLRLDGEERYGLIDLHATAAQARLEWSTATTPDALQLQPTPALELVNEAAEKRTFIVEESQWNDSALRPGQLLSLQDFRDLYAEDYLGSDIQLDVGEQTILFTDIVGSTAMYATRGDPAAFVEVRKQFDELFPIVTTNRGAIVKTIGDALMAAFRNPVDAVKAAALIQRAFHPRRPDTQTRLRISLNTGPCIAVKLNTEVDFFGNTVNVAAKLQSLAEAWQIAMSETTYRAPGVAAWLQSEGATLEDCQYESAALPAAIAAKRWTVFEAG